MSDFKNNMKDIKNIVVATDFSVTSRNAYSYAKALAKTLNASLTLLHVKEDMIMVSDVMIVPLNPEENPKLIKEMEQIITDEEGFVFNELVKTQEVKIKLMKGNPETVLTELSKGADTDLIVMGTTGLSDVLTKIFGSTSQNVSNKAYCPVILVPRDVKWQQLEQIMFASNFDSMTPELVKHITEFALSLSADMHFVNVRDFDPVFEIKQKDIDWKELTKINPDLCYEKHIIYGNDTIEQLKLYSEEKSIDLMVFASKHRNFWQNLAHKSTTENIILSSLIPVMVIHLDDM